MTDPRIARAADALLEATVVGSFTRIGPRVRRRLHDWPASTGRPLDGATALVTGPTSGIGRAAAGQLAALGADLVLVGRSAARLEAVAEELALGGPRPRIEVADLELLGDVAELGARLRDLGRLDVLVHNAGALFREHRCTQEGVERTVALHVLAPFALTTALLRVLRATAGSRVITVASGGMYAQRLDVAALEARAPEAYDGVAAYARAKRAQVELAAAWRRRHPGVAHAAMHPGWVATPGVHDALPGFERVVGPLLRTPDEGADTISWLAHQPAAALAADGIWLDRRPRRVHKVPWTRARDGEADRLWAWCVERTGCDPTVEGI